MKEKNLYRLSAACAILLYVFMGLFFALQYKSSFSQQERELFLILILAYLWIGGLLVYAKIYHQLYIFEPIFFVTILYLGVFVYKPIVDLKNGLMYEHGVYVLNGGAKATCILLFSYTIFFFSYYKRHRRIICGKKQKSIYGDENSERGSSEKNKYTHISTKSLIIAWAIAYMLCLVCMFSQGISLKYIFSLGVDGERIIDDNNTALLFLSNFGITTITIWLMIMIRSKNIVVKSVITILETIYLLVRNARWLILVLGLAPIVYFYIKRKKSPKAITVITLAVGLLIVFAWMQVNRTSLRTGGGYSGWGDSGLTLEILISPFESDFNTYRLFYAMVTRFPKVHGYMLGSTFLYSIVLFIPRALWPGKPDNPVRLMTEYSLNKEARQAGTAVANLGELYANFGVIGCLIGMYLVGWLTQYIKGWLRKEKENELIMYAIMYPLLFQWIARGNFSGNLYMTIFAMAPFIVIRILEKVRIVE